MNLFSFRWFVENLDVVFFIYGLSFVAMGICVLVQPKKESSFKLAAILGFLAGFGLLHGANEFLDMWAIIKGTHPALDAVRTCFLLVSYLLLFEFGRRLVSICGQTGLEKIAKSAGWRIAAGISIIILFFGITSFDSWGRAAIMTRYLFGFFGGLLTSFGFIWYYKCEERKLDGLGLRKYFFLASFSFLVYGILGGLVVPKAGFFPASRINTDVFRSVVGIPVQVFRAFCAAAIALAVYKILWIFDWETHQKLRKEISERERTEEMLAVANAGLEIKVQTRTKELARNYQMQNVINKLLSLSLENISMEEMLKNFLDVITSISWLVLESKGSIFLVEDEPGVLVMLAQKGLSAPLHDICANVPFGRCLCGRAAQSGEIVFAEHVDERHENRYEGMSAHGHYCVPIVSGDKKVLGVINLYIKSGHPRERTEVEFLIAIAETLAGIIERKKMDESLKKTYLQLQETQAQLIQSEKLNAVGRLASGVAHEVRNPLGIIVHGVTYLEKRISSKEKDIVETLNIVKDSVERADRVINTLLDLSRATSVNLQPERVSVILENSLDLVKTELASGNIQVIREIKPDIPEILLDRNKIEQVVINILLNAIQAMPEGGKIFIRAREDELGDVRNGIGKGSGTPFRFGEKAVIIEIEDTGTGIPEENLENIFEPFFTTKRPHGGTGLGLSVSRNIINMHRGLVYAESAPGKGTKMVIILKIAQGG